MRSYEFMFIVDPRLPDEEVVALTDEYREMITSAGARVTKEESWGKRKLAYPIEKLTEGKYVLFYVETPGENPLPQVERRMRQNERIVRYLTVRVDEDLARARRSLPGTEGAAEPAANRPTATAKEVRQ